MSAEQQAVEAISKAVDPLGEGEVAYRPEGVAIVAVNTLRKLGWCPRPVGVPYQLIDVTVENAVDTKTGVPCPGGSLFWRQAVNGDGDEVSK